MSETHGPTQTQNGPDYYEIRIHGHLDEAWVDWFDSMEIVLEASGETRLTGPVADQAALHGLLRKVRDLGMPLLSVGRVDANATCPPELFNTDSIVIHIML